MVNKGLPTNVDKGLPTALRSGSFVLVIVTRLSAFHPLSKLQFSQLVIVIAIMVIMVIIIIPIIIIIIIVIIIMIMITFSGERWAGWQGTWPLQGT